MKFLLLAFTIFAGSQAYVLRDEPYPHLAQFNQEIQEYLNNISRIINERIDYLQKLEISQSLLDQLHNSYAKINNSLRYLEAKMPPEVKKAYNLVVGVSLSVVEKGIDVLSKLKQTVTPATDKVTDSLYNIVAPFANSVLEKVGPYTEALRQALLSRSKGLNPKLVEKLKKQLADLTKQLSPLVQNLQDQLKEFQTSLEPCTDEVQKKFKEGVERLNQQFAPILETLQKYTDSFQKWVDFPDL